MCAWTGLNTFTLDSLQDNFDRFYLDTVRECHSINQEECKFSDVLNQSLNIAERKFIQSGKITYNSSRQISHELLELFAQSWMFDRLLNAVAFDEEILRLPECCLYFNRIKELILLNQ